MHTAYTVSDDDFESQCNARRLRDLRVTDSLGLIALADRFFVGALDGRPAILVATSRGLWVERSNRAQRRSMKRIEIGLTRRIL